MHGLAAVHPGPSIASRVVLHRVRRQNRRQPIVRREARRIRRDMRGRGGGTPAAPSRIVVSLRADAWDALAERAAAAKVPLTRLGVVGGTALTLPDLLDVPIADLRAAWQNALV